MFDAWGEIPSGLLVKNTYNFGAYDECLNVKIENDTNEIKTQYCLMDFNYNMW